MNIIRTITSSTTYATVCCISLLSYAGQSTPPSDATKSNAKELYQKILTETFQACPPTELSAEGDLCAPEYLTLAAYLLFKSSMDLAALPPSATTYLIAITQHLSQKHANDRAGTKPLRCIRPQSSASSALATAITGGTGGCCALKVNKSGDTMSGALLIGVGNNSALSVSSGSVNSPAIAFTSSPATGLYEAGPNTIAISSNGIQSTLIAATGAVTINNPTTNATTPLTVNASQTVAAVSANNAGTGAALSASNTGSGNAIVASAGSLAAPSFGFISNTNTGIYNPAANTIGLVANGIQLFEVTSAGSIFNTGTVQYPGGTATAPTLFFAGSPTTGLYQSGTDQVAITTAGVEQFSVSSTGATFTNGIIQFPDGTAGAPSVIFAGSPTTGLYRPATDQIAISTAGTQRALFTGGTVTINSPTTNNTSLAVTSGQATVTSSFTNTSGSVAALLANATNSQAITSLNTNTTGNSITTNQGSAATPAYSFVTDTTTGVYLSSTGIVGLATGGAARATINGSGTVTINSPTANAGALIVNSAQASAAVTITNSSTGPAIVATSTGPYVIAAENTTTPLNNAILTTPGSNTTPAYSFAGRTGTGLYLKNTFPAIASGGSDVAYFDGTSMVSQMRYLCSATNNTTQGPFALNSTTALTYSSTLVAGSGISPITGAYTVPITGNYLVSFNFSATSANTSTLLITAGILVSSIITSTLTTATTAVSGSWILPLTFNQQIPINVTVTSGGAVTILAGATFNVTFLGF